MENNEENKPMGFLDRFKAPLGYLWDNHKWFLIGFGILILIIKFQDVIIDLLVGNSRKLVKDAVATDSKLKEEQDQANNQANKLVAEAQALSENKSKVDEDWHKK